MPKTPTLEAISRAMNDPALHVDLLLAGTKWADDPRVAAFRKAEEALGDLLWDMHIEAEEREGRLCPACSQETREEETRS